MRITTEKLDELVDEILRQQNFGYQNFQEAKKTFIVCEKLNIEVTIDLLSLHFYSSTLENDEESYVRAKLREKYQLVRTREDWKALEEYYSLRQFMCVHTQLLPFAITKETRPDFVLTDGNNKVGIEITNFTTKVDSILAQIGNDFLTLAETECELLGMAYRKFRDNAFEYSYGKTAGRVSVNRPLHDMRENRKHYAAEVISKYKKYYKEFAAYDVFVVLCDARGCHDVTDYWESEEIVKMAREGCKELQGFTVCILRSDGWSNLCVDSFRL